MDKLKALNTKIEAAKAVIRNPAARLIDVETAKEQLPILEAAANEAERCQPIMTRKRAYD